MTPPSTLASTPAAPGAVNAGRTTAQWQQADAAHFLHPFTDFQSLAKKGSRVIERVARLSKQYGTQIENRNGTGVITM